MYRAPFTADSPYSRSGCTATATLASNVQGVVVQITSRRCGSLASGNVTYTEFVWTLSYPRASSCEESAVPQRLLVQPLEQPPHRLDVLVGVGDVRVLVVEPVRDPLRQRLPIGFIGEDALAAQPVELLDAVGL